jgi:hypothetical protein
VGPLRIAVGGIVHDRWTVLQWFTALQKLNAGRHTIEYIFVCDGEVPVDLPGCRVVVHDLPGPIYDRQPGTDEVLWAKYSRLAFMRNLLADLTMTLECGALLSVDSDIVAPVDLLVRLAETQRDWIAGLVRNSPTDLNSWNVFHFLNSLRQGVGIKPFRCAGVGPEGIQWPPANIPLDTDPRDPQHVRDLATGAVCLYSASLLTAARWHSNLRGCQEDLGFAADAFQAGYRASYLPIICQHLTVDGV